MQRFFFKNRGPGLKHVSKVIVVAVSMFAQASSNSSREEIPRCLHSNGFGGNSFDPLQHSECRDDLLRIGDDNAVIQTEKLFNLDRSEVHLIGCVAAQFSTRPAPSIGFRCIVYYPSGDQGIHYYQGAVLHEIGHCYQLKQAGTSEHLMDLNKGSIERIELGADFLAGLAANNSSLPPGPYQDSLDLVGSFKNDDPDKHGLPADRAGAFRYGLFFSLTATTIDSAYIYFQKNLFGELKHS